MAQADAFIASNTPAATFRATEINYPRPGGSADTLGDLLGPDAVTLDPPSFASASPSLVYRFRGFIAITDDFDIDPTNDTIDLEFAMFSDDASRLRIGGVEVLRLAGDDPDDERGVFFDRTIARFEGAGLYSVDIVWFDYFGGVGIRWFSSIPGILQDDTPQGLGGIVPTSSLYSIPEPSSLVSAALGLAALAGYAGWRRVRSERKKE